MNRNNLTPDDYGTGKMYQRQIVAALFFVPHKQFPETVQP
jgi:hypothetical protein